ncbi:TnpV protein [Paenibacillus sp. FSL M7-0831]|uniref:TnpV protein n=1 Tax=Paenibacillus sp. FSL M7-0831 TaxID=2975314 RepID=UPI004046F335
MRTSCRFSISIPRPRLGRWERRSARSTSRCCGRSASPFRTMSANNSRKGALHMENNLTYTRNGDYLIPDLKLSEQPEKPLGKYGRMRKAYLKEHRPLIYNQLLQTEKLYPHLLEIDETANSRLEQMMPQLAESAGATEELKARDPMRWVGLMNTCKAQAEEILMAELINS